MDTLANRAPTPPMGWNSFDAFGGRATEGHIIANADYLAEHLKCFGWEYVVIDIAWYADYATAEPAYAISALHMDDHGRLIPSPKRFPSSSGGKGLKPLADHIHAKGLKFGIHIMRGIPRVAVERNTPVLGSSARAADVADKTGTCHWWEHMYGVDPARDGARAYYDSIVRLYAEWGVDFIKADDMSRPYYPGEIELLAGAIERCGRQIVLSLSPGPTQLANASHVKSHANMWRLSADLWDKWPDILKAFDYAEQWNPYRQPGHWPDLDMLPLGRLEILPAERGPKRWTLLTPDEQITMMTLWSIFRSPLMVGGDLPSMDDWTLSLLANKEVLDVARSSFDNRQLYRTDEEAAWTARGPRGQTCLALFNLRGKSAEVSVELEQLGLAGRTHVRDLWSQADIGDARLRLAAKVPAHGARLFRLRDVEGSGR